jgi:two-component system NtrC family sensor kinase
MGEKNGVLESVLNQVPDGVMVVVGPEQRIVFANEAARRIVGHDSEKSTLAEIDASFQFYRPNGEPILAHALPLSRSLTEGVVIRGEEMVVEGPDGVRYSLRASAAPILWPGTNGDPEQFTPGAVAIFQEMGERLRQEAALRETVARLEAAQERQRHLAGITRAITSSLDLNQVLEMIRCAVIEALGFDRAGIFLVDEERPILRGVCGTDRHGRRESLSDFSMELLAESDWPMDRIYRGEIEYFLTENWTRDGDWPEGHPCHQVKAHALVPFRADGRVLGILAVDNLLSNRPIAEDEVQELFLFADTAAVAIQNARLYAEEARRAAEREKALERTQEKLIESERTAIVGQFASKIVHDLRNPLNVFQLNLQLLRSRAKDDELLLRPLDRLDHAAARAGAMVADLLDLARLGTPKPAPTPIRPLLERVKEDVACPDEVQVEIDCRPDLPILLADVEQIRRALWHLMTNALWALGEAGGTIRLAAQVEGDLAFLSVTDTGCGIPKEEISRIFQPFYALRPRGNGLGLTVCRNIVENHAGTIAVDSRVNHGSTITIRLPLAGCRDDDQGTA